MIQAESICKRQAGVTLLEVMVGFVVFTSSLVVVLDYVSNHVYQGRLTDEGLHKTGQIYAQTVVMQGPAESRMGRALGKARYDVLISSSVMDAKEIRGQEITLLRDQYQINDRDGSFTWTVLRSQQQ